MNLFRPIEHSKSDNVPVLSLRLADFCSLLGPSRWESPTLACWTGSRFLPLWDILELPSGQLTANIWASTSVINWTVGRVPEALSWPMVLWIKCLLLYATEVWLLLGTPYYNGRRQLIQPLMLALCSSGCKDSWKAMLIEQLVLSSMGLTPFLVHSRGSGNSVSMCVRMCVCVIYIF